ncbi:MAG: PQQ-dependent sugar dehydrogenase [Candidatus Zixiibacteriota bacterium]
MMDKDNHRERLESVRHVMGILAGVTVLLAFAATSMAAVTTVRIASGLNRPVYLCAPPGDYHRLFVVEQDGMIRIIKDGALLSGAFLDVSAISSCCGERGLLGLAFHPQYAQNGYFYVNYTNNSGSTVIARYSVSADPDSADPAGALILKTIAQPESNHNGGCLQFGPDGKLYVGMGDGGGANDQHGTIGNGQNPGTLLGKLLRLDVDIAAPYVPVDNPYVGVVDTLPEIWAFGLRNPWRFGFDRLNGNLYIADVGQSAREEVDFQPAASAGGENYGWRCMEGTICTGMTGCTCNAPRLTLPIHEYTHSDGCSITGGYVYRGCAIAELAGTYVFADYCAGTIWSFQYDGVTKSNFQDRTAELDPPGTPAISQVTSFGEDAYGELYILDYFDGEAYKIVPAAFADCDSNHIADSCQINRGVSADTNSNGVPDGCESACLCPCHGDPLCDGVPNVSDVVLVVSAAFRGAAPITDPGCPHVDRCDINCDCVTTVQDVVGMVNRAFRGDATPFCDPCALPCP